MKNRLKNEALLHCYGLEAQFPLWAGWPAKCGGGKLRAFPAQSRFAAGHVEHGGDLFGEDAVSGHSRTKIGIVELASTNRPDAS